jgi:hypothetical protein
MYKSRELLERLSNHQVSSLKENSCTADLVYFLLVFLLLENVPSYLFLNTSQYRHVCC